MVVNLDKSLQHKKNWLDAYGVCHYIICWGRGMADAQYCLGLNPQVESPKNEVYTFQIEGK